MKNKIFMWNKDIKKIAFCWAVLLTSVLSSSIGEAETEIELWKKQTIYVPVYSHVLISEGKFPFYLAVTLSIQNTDLTYPITVTSVDYYDSAGKMLRKFLEAPIQLNPLGSVDYVIKESDKSGGIGANLIIRWKSEVEVNPPIVQAVMIGARSQQGISFVSSGQVIKEHSE